MKTMLAALFTLSATTAALAHPGHLADEGHGHSHYIALAIFLGVAAISAGLVLRRALRKRAERRAMDGAET
ncbi:DUF6732 family protein [Kaustia mangrovi]|nr:DUF6732 family protein [Kaustia mangrovi]